MILLNEEEIWAVINEVEQKCDINPDAYSPVMEYRAMCKAQLKKVYDWLQSRTYGFDNGDGKMTYKTVYEEGEWQSLLDEIGEGD